MLGIPLGDVARPALRRKSERERTVLPASMIGVDPRGGRRGSLRGRSGLFAFASRLVREDMTAPRAFERLIAVDEIRFDSVTRPATRSFDDQAADLTRREL